MELRKVKKEEIRSLAQLASEIWHEYWPCILSEEQINYMVEKFQSEEAIENQIEKEYYTYFYIEVDGKVVGYIGVCDKVSLLMISKFYIKKEYRHKGYGKLAMDKMKNLGYNKFLLTVNRHNQKAIDAYLKYGFKTIEEKVTDIGSGFVMDDYIMELNI